MKRTVSIPVNLPHERFLPLMGFCADIFNQHVDWALKERTWNKNKAHKALYADRAEDEMSATLAGVPFEWAVVTNSHRDRS